jgi:pimeloyl-ACP methyl ester carboxylesterase
MNYPIVKVQTEDGLMLHGLLTEPQSRSKTLKIHIHGTSGSFYWNRFVKALADSAAELNIAQLAFNNRGSGGYDLEKGRLPRGSALERFQDCLLDIDAWIEFGRARGFERFILEGHSFGTEKAVYYMQKGRYSSSVSGLILLGFSDTVGSQQLYHKETSGDYFREAQRLSSEGQGQALLSDLYALCGECPISAGTYLDFFADNSELSRALPLRQGKDLQYFAAIKVPILGLIGDRHEYTVIPIKAAVELLRRENPLAEVVQFAECSHNFESKEAELCFAVSDFIRRRLSSLL